MDDDHPAQPAGPVPMPPLGGPPRPGPMPGMPWDLLRPLSPEPSPPEPQPFLVITEDDPELSEVPLTKPEITAACWGRPANKRTPVPKVGDRVLFRMHEFGDFLDAVVTWVQPMDRPGAHPDPHIWRRHNFTGAVLGLHDDPWPEVELDTYWGHLKSRESRARGSAGWVPLDWDPPRPTLAELARYS